jgi:hypothetical protein
MILHGGKLRDRPDIEYGVIPEAKFLKNAHGVAAETAHGRGLPSSVAPQLAFSTLTNRARVTLSGMPTIRGC